jgi:hypothetical protein
MTTLIPKFDLKNGGTTPTGAVNRAINLKLAETVSVQDFGAIGNGTTDDTTAFQNALTYGAANNQPIFIPRTVGGYKLTSGLTIDLSKTTLLSNGATLNFSTLASGNALTYVFTTSSTGINSAVTSGGFLLIGGSVSNTVGIFVGQTGAYNINDLLFENIAIRFFDTNILYGPNAWRVAFSHCESVQPILNHVHFPTASLVPNAGETMAFINCIFANGDGTQLLIEAGQFDFSDCTFLNCGLIVSGDTYILITGGHFEAPGYVGTGYRQISMTAGYVQLVGVNVLGTGTGAIMAPFYVSSSPGSGLVINGCALPMVGQTPEITDNVRTFVAGPGPVQLTNAQLSNIYAVADMFPISTYNNLIYNGNAETGTTAGWTQTTVSGTGAFSASTAAKKNEIYGFDISTTGAGSVFEVSQTFQVTPGKTVLCGMWWKGISGNTKILLRGYAADGTNILFAQYTASTTGTWTTGIGTISRVIPVGCVTCQIVVQGYAGSEMYFDDVIINQI